MHSCVEIILALIMCTLSYVHLKIAVRLRKRKNSSVNLGSFRAHSWPTLNCQSVLLYKN